MAFCTKCGRQINDGEVCSCQSGSMNVDVSAVANGLIGSGKDIIADPEGGSGRFIAGITWAKVAILSAIYAIMTIIFNIFDKISRNIDTKKRLKETFEDNEDLYDSLDIDFEDFLDDSNYPVYEFGDFIKGIFQDLIYIAAGIAITAVIFFFAMKLIQKIEITWQAAFALSVIDLIAMIPLTLCYEVLGLLPDFTLLSWIMSAIISVRGLLTTVLVYFGIKNVCGNSTSAIYVAVPAFAASSIAISFVNFLINSLIFN